MPDVAVHDLQAGSVLAEPVLDPAGRILLQRGAVLTPGLIRRLSRWHVSEVCVLDEVDNAFAVDREDSTGEPGPVDPGTPAGDPRVIWDKLFAPTAHSAESRCVHGALVHWYETQTAASQHGTE